MPDLLGYWLTGVRAAEQTNASTTGLLDARTGDWAPELVEGLGLPAGLLPDVLPAGRVLAGLTGPVRAELGVDHELLVSTVGSHDTASAVVGVPAATPRFGYVSCGTWGLVGVELDAPVLTEASRRANFTNERGVDGTIRYLRNVMGLWLLSESLRAWNRRGLGVELGEVLAAAAALPPGGPRIDPDDPAFLPPGDMPARIARAAERRHRRQSRGRRALHPRQPRGRVRRRDRRGRAAVRTAGGGRAPRRRRRPQRAALPADRRRRRPCRCWPARPRRPRSATCWCRPAPTARWPATWPRCGPGSAPPPAWTGTSRADRLRPSARGMVGASAARRPADQATAGAGRRCVPPLAGPADQAPRRAEYGRCVPPLAGPADQARPPARGT